MSPKNVTSQKRQRLLTEMAFTEDLSVFFDPDGFAVEGVFTRGDDVVTVYGIMAVGDEEAMSMNANRCSFVCASSGVVAVRRGDKAVVEGAQYTVLKNSRKLGGISTIQLEAV